MFTSALRITLPFICIFFNAIQTRAHEEASNGDPIDMAYRYGLLLERISDFQDSQVEFKPGKATPYIYMDGQRYYINNAFYNLQREIFRIYTSEISQVCPECKVPSVDQLLEEARELVARGWMERTAGKTVEIIAGRYGSEFVDLGARYGTTAGLLKVAGELGEDALLVIFKMPGAHILCDIITLVIAVNAGRTNTLFRTFMHGRYLGRNGFRQMARLVATSYVVRRSLKRTHFDFGPVEVDPALFEAKHLDDAKKEWLRHEISHEKNYKKFFSKIAQLITEKNHELNDLRNLTIEAEGRELKRLEKQIRKKQKQVEKLISTNQKVFEGRRRGLSLFLFKRNRSTSLYSSEPDLNSSVRGSKLWLVPMQADIIEPGFRLQEMASEKSLNEYAQRVSSNQHSLTDSPVNELLIEEAKLKGIDSNVAKEMFSSLEFIFDTNASQKQRYFEATMVQGLVGEFLYQSAKSYFREIRNEIFLKNGSMKAIWEILKVQWNIVRLTYYANDYVDFLKSVSLTKGPSPLVSEKHLAKDYLIRVFDAYKALSFMKEDADLRKVMFMREILGEKKKGLDTGRFWIEKKAGYTFLPVRQTVAALLGLGRYQYARRRVQCAQLYY